MQSINASVVGATMKARSAPITAGLFALDLIGPWKFKIDKVTMKTQQAVKNHMLVSDHDWSQTRMD